MKLVVITKVFSDGTVRISSKPLSPKTNIMDLVSSLNYLISIGALCTYEIEIITN